MGFGSFLKGVVGDVVGGLTGKTAADATMEASNVSAQAEHEKLAYLKEINALPQQYKEQALTKLASIYGVDGDTSGQQEVIDLAKSSPYYNEIMGGLQAGEESIMRNAAATGGLRSGNTQYNLADYATQLKNKALTTSYGNIMGGIQGLTGIGTNEAAIGNTMSNIGNIQAAGITGAAQAQQQGISNLMNLGLGIGGLLVGKGV